MPLLTALPKQATSPRAPRSHFPASIWNVSKTSLDWCPEGISLVLKYALRRIQATANLHPFVWLCKGREQADARLRQFCQKPALMQSYGDNCIILELTSERIETTSSTGTQLPCDKG